MISITRTPRAASRFLIAIICLCILARTATAQATPALKLIPMPREVQAAKLLPLERGILIRNASRDADDRFTMEDLRATLKERGIPARTAGSVIELLRANTPTARALLASAHISFEPAMHDEGYVILPRRRGLAVIAETAAGLFYGAQTVKQLVIVGEAPGDGAADRTNALLQTATIRDWPALAHRGLDDDLSRGPVPTLEFQKRQVRSLAAYKINIYSPYFEHTLQYSASPLVAPPGGSMSPADVAELIR
ncbi:MAG TPA: glycoside hydrolase family 20 zincin-like fold domain-containing protein, partial [Acidobacteriaceae bacterium]